MAQHRTKEDKVNAHIHRIESSKLYSLSDLDKNVINAVSISQIKKPHSLGVNMLTVKADLLRTAISLSIILVLLVAGFFFLR